MRCSLSGNLATMGCGIPYALGAKFANPHLPAVALVGDGAVQMNGLLELLTVAKYWKSWADPRFVVMVLHNNDLNQVTWEMRAMEGDPKFQASQDIPDFNYAQFADLVGLKGIRVESPEAVGPAWDEAFGAGKPVVIDAVTDPNIPPLPPHITWKQAQAMMSSMLKGDPDLGAVVRKSFRGVMREFVHPHRHGK
jgi:pyruvate dehydrogenase (quinone)